MKPLQNASNRVTSTLDSGVHTKRARDAPTPGPMAQGDVDSMSIQNPSLTRTSTPGIYRRGSRYVVVWRHRGRQHKSFHRTLAEAREAKGARQAGERQPATRKPLEDYAREWIDGYAGRTSRGFSEQTRSDYRRSLETYVIPFFAGWKLADIDRSDIRRLVKSLEDHGLAPASVVKNLTPAKAMFATAVDDDLLKSNPCSGVRVNRRRGDAEEAPEAKAMTRAELATLMAEIPDRWLLLFELLAKTGLRISEALGLDWSDVDFGKLTLRVRRQYYRGDLRQLKTHSGRRDLPLSPGLARRLWKAQGTGPVFCTRDGQSSAGSERAPGARRGGRTGRAGVGSLPRIPPYVRVDAVRARARTSGKWRLGSGTRTRRSP